MQVNRRAFLVALGAAPSASLMQWRTPAAATWVGVDWGAGHSAAVLAFYEQLRREIWRFTPIDVWRLEDWQLDALMVSTWREFGVLEPKVAWLREDQERPPPG